MASGHSPMQMSAAEIGSPRSLVMSGRSAGTEAFRVHQVSWALTFESPELFQNCQVLMPVIALSQSNDDEDGKGFRDPKRVRRNGFQLAPKDNDGVSLPFGSLPVDSQEFEGCSKLLFWFASF